MKLWLFALLSLLYVTSRGQCQSTNVSGSLPSGHFVFDLALMELKLSAQSALTEWIRFINKFKQLGQDSLADWNRQSSWFNIPFMTALSSVQASSSLTNLQRQFPALFNFIHLLNNDSQLKKQLLNLVLPSLIADTRATPPEMIKSRGFNVEPHHVITEDCYVILVYRIVHPNLSENQKRRPILLQHGLLSTPADFLMNSPGGRVNDNDNRNLAFALARIGYDVWLSNSRGNAYSRNHTQFDADKDEKFWQFTFDEMSKFDLPATFGYIQHVTGHETVGYVGHSQGTLIMFQLLATRPELSQIVQPFIALAPVFQLNNVKSPLRFFALLDELQKTLLRYPDSFLNLKSNPLWSLSVEYLCQDPLDNFCATLYFLVGGYDPQQLNTTRIPVYLNNYPAGTSTYNVVHYGQLLREKKVRWFNYRNSKDNMACYGNEEPPVIDLKKIDSSHITLISSNNDWLAGQENIDFIRSELKVKFGDHVVSYPDWNHFDFVLGIENDKYVNDLVIDLLKKYDVPSEIKSAFNLPVYNENTCDIKAKCYLNNPSLIV